MRVCLVSVLLLLGFPFIMSDLVPFTTCSGSFFKGVPPKITGILEDSKSRDNNIYTTICQRSGNIYGYATLYDNKKKIPVFSAYEYTGRSPDFKTPPRDWKNDPELENTKQYYTSLKELHLSRGHIFPMSYAFDIDTAKSTCRVTNIVPQVDTFNSLSWERMEQKVKRLMDSFCRDEADNNKISAFGLTGAVPSADDLMNEKVNIPSHMWTAFCCYNIKSKKWESQAHWAQNIHENKDEGKTITEQSLNELQAFLKGKYNTEYTLFNGECLDPFTADVSEPNEQQNNEEQTFLQYLRSLAASLWAGVQRFFFGNVD